MKTEFQFSPWLAAGLCLLCFWDGGGLFWPFLLGILLHEGGHLLAMKGAGVPIRRFSLGLTGAVIETGPCPSGKEALVTAAGPAVNGLLAVFGYYVDQRILFVNLLLLIYNLLPIYPLDGGRLVRLGACAALGPERGRQLCRGIALLVISAVGIWGVWACFVDHQGLLPCLIAGLFLLRLPKKG